MKLQTRGWLAFVWLCSHFIFAGTTNAEDEAEPVEFDASQIHSDLPIYTYNFDELWPRRIGSEDAIAGCSTRVSFGDWKFTPNTQNQMGDPWWLRVENYGVFHCAANLYAADTRDDLKQGEFTRGFFVRIGYEDADKPERELWVLQDGFVPGSDYILLAREANNDFVTSFTVLQRRCPIGANREVLDMGSWKTNYCAINSDTDLYRLANEMLKLPPLGALILQKDPAAEVTTGSQ